MRFYSMARPVKSPRAYDSTRRRESADQTRERVLAAAREQFLLRGFASATVAEIAAAAGVAPQTLYSSVGSKAELLRQVMHVAIAGDHLPVAVAERPFTDAIHAEPDGRRKLALYARRLRPALERTAVLDGVVRAAADADPAVAALSRELDDQRVLGMRMFAGHLQSSGVLRRGITVDRAADILSAHMDPRLYLWLVSYRGWSGRQYETWYTQITSAALIQPGETTS
jgi:AcrR family transcriptional regulator